MNETTIWHALARAPPYCFPVYLSFCLRAVKTIQWNACQRVPTAGTGPILWPVIYEGGGLGTLNVEGPASVSGTMIVQANIVQANNPYAHIEIDGGHLSVLGSVTGGNIAITSGTLEFQNMAFSHGPELESQNFTSTLSFNGKSGAVEFGGLIGPLTIGINIPLKEIAVFNEGEQIANFHLGPAAPGTYSAANFSVKGNELIYHHS